MNNQVISSRNTPVCMYRYLYL